MGKFAMGQIVLTRGVYALAVSNSNFNSFVQESLKRHSNGDWGDLCPEDREENEIALREGNLRLFSSYEKEGLPKIWIITEADRSSTTVLFPDEY